MSYHNGKNCSEFTLDFVKLDSLDVSIIKDWIQKTSFVNLKNSKNTRNSIDFLMIQLQPCPFATSQRGDLRKCICAQDNNFS